MRGVTCDMLLVTSDLWRFIRRTTMRRKCDMMARMARSETQSVTEWRGCLLSRWNRQASEPERRPRTTALQ